MSRPLILFVLTAVQVFLLGSIAAAQENGTFEKLHKEYTDNVAEIAKLSSQIQALDQKIEAVLPALKQAAARAYEQSKGNNTAARDVLIQLVQRDFATDNFEHAASISNRLITYGHKDKQLYDLAGVAAFAVNRFDTAAEYFKLATEEKTLSDLAKFWQERLTQQQQAWEREQKLRMAEAKADDLPRVELTTSKGVIVLELFENEAPMTVANFVSLVEKKFFDGIAFHRVIQGFVAQGGCPNGDGTGDPGYAIPCECYVENHRVHFRGSMAHKGRDTGGSQFYLTFVPTIHLNGTHTVFGRVIEGIDLLSKLQRIDPDASNGRQPDKIIQAKVLRKRDHDYVPTRVNK